MNVFEKLVLFVVGILTLYSILTMDALTLGFIIGLVGIAFTIVLQVLVPIFGILGFAVYFYCKATN